MGNGCWLAYIFLGLEGQFGVQNPAYKQKEETLELAELDLTRDFSTPTS